MKVKIKSLERGEPGVVGGGQRKYYATIVRRDPIEFRDFLGEIGDLSTVNTPDVFAVMESLFKLIPKHLSGGRTIRFGHLGDFYLSLSSDSEESPYDVNANSVRGARIVYRPSLEMKDFINNLKFIKVGNPILEPGVDAEAPPGPDEEPLEDAA